VVLFSLFFFNYIIESFFILPYHGLFLFYLLFILLSILFLFFCFSSESPILADVVCGHYAFLVFTGEDIEIPSRSIYCSLEFLCFHLWMCAGFFIFFSFDK
jgi:hypothetical protein